MLVVRGGTVTELAPAAAGPLGAMTSAPISPLLSLLRLARPLRSRLLIAAGAGAMATGCGVALLAVSGFLLARASQHPDIAALSVAVVAVRGLSIGRGRLPVCRAACLARRRVPGSGPDPGRRSGAGSRRSRPPGCPRSGPATCWPGWSATSTPPRTCSSAESRPRWPRRSSARPRSWRAWCCSARRAWCSRPGCWPAASSGRLLALSRGPGSGPAHRAGHAASSARR